MASGSKMVLFLYADDIDVLEIIFFSIELDWRALT